MEALKKTVESILKPISTILPFGREKDYISLDVGSSSIKIVEVGGQGPSLKVTNVGIIPLPLDAVQSNFVQDSSRVCQAIRTLIEENRIKSTDVITAVPGPAVIIKRVAFPIQDPETLEETILFEAGNFIPESLDNVNLDYQILDADPETDNIDVLLVAVRKDKRQIQQRELQLMIVNSAPKGGGTNAKK